MVADLWRRLVPPRYAVAESTIVFNTVASGLFLPDVSVLRDEGFLLVKSSKFGKEGRAYISAMAFRDRAAWSQALEECLAQLAAAGLGSVQFGGDWRHFFPGAPTDWPELTAALIAAGFEEVGGPVYDVERDLTGYSPPVPTSPDVRACRSTDRDALDKFLAREFAGRWHTDVMEVFDEHAETVYGLYLDGRCSGFAMTQREGCENPRAGGVWAADLGPKWAALGPIGVSKAVRGQGHGHALLASALSSLRDLGARRTIIDWTTLLEFYGRHGFGPSREYRTFVRSLETFRLH